MKYKKGNAVMPNILRKKITTLQNLHLKKEGAILEGKDSTFTFLPQIIV
jgi:hypothetical protein